MKADHPSNTKGGGVCIYCKNIFYVIRRIVLSDVQECTVAEITVDKERCFLIFLYRSPSQNDEELKTFCLDVT